MRHSRKTLKPNEPIYELGIMKRFEFDSKLQRMSVVVKNMLDGDVRAYVKGSPEKIAELCRKSSLPADYEQQLAKSTQKGLRVIAIAVKLFENIDSMEIQSLKRDHVENDLHFLGFLVMENKLKEQTCETIDTLNDC